MGANIKIQSDSKQFINEMKQVTESLKLIDSEMSLVTTNANLFGTESDKLSAKQKELSSTIKGQTTILGLQKQTIQALTGDLEKYKSRNAELVKSIESVEKQLKNEIKANGENSEQSKKLSAELNKLQREFNQNDKAIDKSIKQINNYKIKANETEKTILQNKKALEELNNETEKSPSKWEKLSESIKKSEDNMSSIAKGMVGLGGVIVGAIGGAVVAGVNGSQDLTKAMNNLQVKTGASAEEIQEFGDIAQNVFANNFGEDFGDITNVMADINRVLGQTGEELQQSTEYAIGLRDSFDYEVNESVRAVDQLMKQFGVTSEEAFNLIAQGSQKGLDFSGEMIDTIVEYSVHFNKLGLDAEEMFNILLSGSQDGAFNLDKIGDAVKELSIRLVDGSKTTKEGLESLGLSSDDVAKKISSGGDEAQKTYYKITESLANMTDKQKQNEIGVQLFGTMWEDLGPKVIGSLQNMNDAFNGTIPTMKELNNIKYNDLGSGLEGIKRQLQTGITGTITEKVLPKVNELANNIQSNMPQIQGAISNALDTAMPLLGGFSDIVVTIAANWDTLLPILTSATIIIGGFKILSTVNGFMEMWKASTFAQTLAQEGLNAALMANPIGLIIGLIGLLVGGFMLAWNHSEKFRNTVIWAFNGVENECKFAVGWIDNNLRWLANEVEYIFNGIVWIFEHPFDALKIAARETLNWLVNKFKSLDLSLPHIKLPHFSVEGYANPLKWLEYGVPKVKINWYAQGGIMTKPTIFGASGNGLNIGGEAGHEAVLPLKVLWNELSKNFDKLEERLNNNKETVLYVTNITTLDGKEIARNTEKHISNNQKARNFGRGNLGFV